MRSTYFATYLWAVFLALLLRHVEAAGFFHHRVNHDSIIVGNYLYIDGGEIIRWNGSGNGIFGSTQCSEYDGAGCPGDINLIADNNTYSIDLTSSWINETVILNSIYKTAPVLKGEGLWAAGDNKTFYSYGGTSGGPGGLLPIPGNELWRFTPSGNTGSWSNVGVTSQSENFSSLSRTVSGGYASGRGLGFSLGGVQSLSPDPLGNIPSPGMVVYNTSSQLWYNVSALGQPSGEFYLGAAQFVPSFGPEGLMVVIAGATPREGFGDAVLLDTGTVSIYEPLSQQWKTQTVTGSVPSPCIQPSVVGAQGDNATYEIFMYGGFDSTSIGTTIGLGSVYVLSLPSFNWQKANYVPQFGRFGHSCSVVGRQMISVGGSVLTQDAYNANGDNIPDSVTDPWAQGIGVFDMTDMVWKDSYDAAAGPYTKPAMVKQYYESNQRYPSSLLSDPVLRSWFMKEANTTSPGPSSTPKPATRKSDAGAIAGGVVGGVVGLAFIVGVLWWLARRQTRPPLKRSSSEHRKAELENTNYKGYRRYRDRQPPAEAGGSPLHEMEGSKPSR